jgi:hypothetical protein
MSTDDAAFLVTARLANKMFVIPGDIDRLLLPMSACEPAASSPYRSISAAFSTNIRSVINPALIGQWSVEKRDVVKDFGLRLILRNNAEFNDVRLNLFDTSAQPRFAAVAR